MPSLQTLSVRADADLNPLTRKLREAQQGTERFADRGVASFQKFTTGVNPAKLAIAGFTVTLTAGVLAINNFITGAGELGKELQNSARLAGLSTDSFQRITFAARLAGHEIGEVEDLFKDFGDRLGDAASGADAWVQNFRAIEKAGGPALARLIELYDAGRQIEAIQLYREGLNQLPLAAQIFRREEFSGSAGAILANDAFFESVDATNDLVVASTESLARATRLAAARDLVIEQSFLGFTDGLLQGEDNVETFADAAIEAANAAGEFSRELGESVSLFITLIDKVGEGIGAVSDFFTALDNLIPSLPFSGFEANLTPPPPGAGGFAPAGTDPTVLNRNAVDAVRDLSRDLFVEPMTIFQEAGEEIKTGGRDVKEGAETLQTTTIQLSAGLQSLQDNLANFLNNLPRPDQDRELAVQTLEVQVQNLSIPSLDERERAAREALRAPLLGANRFGGNRDFPVINGGAAVLPQGTSAGPGNFAAGGFQDTVMIPDDFFQPFAEGLLSSLSLDLATAIRNGDFDDIGNIFADTLLSAMTQPLVDIVGDIASGFLNELTKSFTSGLSGDAFEQFGASLAQGLVGFFSGLSVFHEGSHGPIPGRPGQEMLAVLESGETVLSRRETDALLQGGGQGISVAFNINGDVTAATLQAISQNANGVADIIQQSLQTRGL